MERGKGVSELPRNTKGNYLGPQPPDRHFQRNPQVCHMTDTVKQLPSKRSQRKKQEEDPLCEEHHEVVALFCEKDLDLLCPSAGLLPPPGTAPEQVQLVTGGRSKATLSP